MSDQILKDRSGHKIGVIKEQGRLLVAYDAHGHKLGVFDPERDLTQDAHGRKVGSGNLLAALILQAA